MAGVAKLLETNVTWLSLRLLRYAIPRWPALLSVLATILLKTVLDVLRPWPMKFLVDNVLSGEPMPPALARSVERLPGGATPAYLLAWCIAATVVLFLLGWALSLASAYANISFGRRMAYDLAADLFRHLQRLSLRFHSRKSVGDSIRRVMVDSGSVSTIVQDALLPALTSLISLIIMFAVMWQLDRTLTLLSLTVVPFLVLVLHRYAGPMLERGYAQQEIEGRMYDTVEQTLSTIPIVKAFGREEEADREFQANTSATLAATLSTTNVQLQFQVLTGFATAAGTAAILWVGARHVLDGQLTVGSILVFLSYLASLYGPLESLMYTSSTIQGAAGSAQRVMEVLETATEVTEKPGAVSLAAVEGNVRFENVTFGYEPGRPILQDVSMAASPGQRVAIIGVTGAGKSTLLSLVPRFYDPWAGRVTVDGHDLRDVQVKSLRDHIAIVLQEPFLFPRTVAENIAYGRPAASQEEIRAAAVAARADDFIMQLPQGYDTVIGERGATLSGGERQRIAIARALLKDAPILILDEPTSALDAETENQLMQALDRLMEGRTTFIIAHRLSTIRRADQIVVLQDGKVAEQGTHAELLAQGHLYAHLQHLQSIDSDQADISGRVTQ